MSQEDWGVFLRAVLLPALDCHVVNFVWARHMEEAQCLNVGLPLRAALVVGRRQNAEAEAEAGAKAGAGDGAGAAEEESERAAGESDALSSAIEHLTTSTCTRVQLFELFESCGWVLEAGKFVRSGDPQAWPLLAEMLELSPAGEAAESSVTAGSTESPPAIALGSGCVRISKNGKLVGAVLRLPALPGLPSPPLRSPSAVTMFKSGIRLRGIPKEFGRVNLGALTAPKAWRDKLCTNIRGCPLLRSCSPVCATQRQWSCLPFASRARLVYMHARASPHPHCWRRG